jgi:hypothetical protein
MDENLNVAANVEEPAAPQIDVEQTPSTEVTAEPTEKVESTQQQETDITQTQAFSKRLKEETSKAAQKAQDELIASMYGESHGIYTKSDYDKAVQKAKEEQEIQQSIEKGIDPEIARELQEAKKFRQQYETEKQTKAQQEKQQKDYQSFIETYPGVKADEIPVQVWEEVNKGKSLVDAYAKHENSILKAKLAEYEKGSKVQQVNANNAATSTGSVTGNGQSAIKEITAESIATMSEQEISKNWNQVKKILNMR